MRSPKTVQESVQWLASLEPRGRVASRPGFNSHVHLPPNFSAFDTLDELFAQAKAEGIRVLGASNYYDFAVYHPFVVRCRQEAIMPLLGVEVISLDPALAAAKHRVNDPSNPGRTYLCGKGLWRWASPPAKAAPLLRKIRQTDAKRMDLMATKLEEAFAKAGYPTGLTAKAIIAQVAARTGSDLANVFLQERHLARAFQESLFSKVPLEARTDALTKVLGASPKGSPDKPSAVQNEIRSHLLKAGRPAYAPEEFVAVGEAIQLVLLLGGIPTYPILADGASPLCEFEQSPKVLAEHLRNLGIWMAEFIPNRNKPDVLLDFAKGLRAEGIVVTAGTEHNSVDRPPLVPQCADGSALSSELSDLFWEGACVVAAHQVLAPRQGLAYVTSEGALSASFHETRIAELASAGEGLIASIS